MLQYSIESIKPGMVIGKPILNESGKLLLGKGVILNVYYIRRLKNIGISSLFIKDGDDDDIEPRESISEIVRGATIKDLRALFGPVEELAREIKTQSFSALKETISSERFQKTFRDNPAFKRVISDASSIVDELIAGETTIGLNSIKSYDNYTFQHSIDVSIVAIMIGRKIGLEHKRLREIGIGCLLHDIGKTFVPIEILNKEGKLTDKEFKAIQEHPLIGYELTKDVPSIGVLPPHIALQHHEHQDSTGYPRRLKGDNKLTIASDHNIHLYGSIAAVADVYDALSSDRPYRKGFPPEKVISMMREMHTTHLNREVLRLFLAVTPVYPQGSTIQVLSGPYKHYLGVVAEVNSQYLDRPSIRLVINAKRVRIPPIEINLADNEDTFIETVLL